MYDIYIVFFLRNVTRSPSPSIGDSTKDTGESSQEATSADCTKTQLQPSKFRWESSEEFQKISQFWWIFSDFFLKKWQKKGKKQVETRWNKSKQDEQDDQKMKQDKKKTSWKKMKKIKRDEQKMKQDESR